MAYIEFRKIDKYYGSNQVLKGISLSVEKGQFVTLLGPSGCGKSTLLRCLAGLEELSEGEILLDGEDITDKEPKDRNIGMVFQQYSLFPNMTVEENIAFGLKLKKMPPQLIREKVEHIIEIVELQGKEKQYPASLSGGQQQRVALARSIVMEPKVLLLDEPLSAIDAKLRKSLQISIKQITKKMGLTAIFVTHDQDEAMIMSDVIHLFHDGKIEQSGDPVSVYTRPVSSFAAGFMGNYNLLTLEEFKTMTGREKTGAGEVA
ncbi:MAG: ABC transporter ATP-binding protein, partial [Hungatella sp.]